MSLSSWQPCARPPNFIIFAIRPFADMSIPTQIPSFIFTGEQQLVVFDYNRPLPSHCNIITLTFVDRNNHNYGRVPAEKIGPKAIKALLPTFTVSGEYSVTPKFDLTENSCFGTFDIKVYSPFDVMQKFLMPWSPMTTNDTYIMPFTAALISYFVQLNNHHQDDISQNDIEMVDSMLFAAVTRLENPLSFTISSLTSGKQDGRNLLDFAQQHKLAWTSDFLSKLKLDPNIPQQQMAPPPPSEQVQESSSGAAGSISAFAKAGMSKLGKLKTKVKHKKKKPQAEFIEQLKLTALYSATVVCSYHCSNNVDLDGGDIVYVIREEPGNMCKSISKDKYIEIPLNILQPIKQTNQETEHDSCDDDNNDDDDDDDSYENYGMVETTLGITDSPKPPSYIEHGRNLMKFRTQSYDSSLDEVTKTTTPSVPSNYSPQLVQKRPLPKPPTQPQPLSKNSGPPSLPKGILPAEPNQKISEVPRRSRPLPQPPPVSSPTPLSSDEYEEYSTDEYDDVSYTLNQLPPAPPIKPPPPETSARPASKPPPPMRPKIHQGRSMTPPPLPSNKNHLSSIKTSTPPVPRKPVGLNQSQQQPQQQKARSHELPPPLPSAMPTQNNNAPLSKIQEIQKKLQSQGHN